MKKLTLLFLLTFLANLATHAQLQRADTKESLRGLTGVYVIAQVIDVQPQGMNTNHLVSVVRAALAAADITTTDAPKKANGDANLSITVDIIEQTQLHVYAFTVEVAVTQNVRLARDASAKNISAETWRRSLQGLTSPDRLDIIDQALQQTTHLFITDYHAVNPAK